MTIIAWDGVSLAADKAATCVGYSRTVTKIFTVPDGIVGLAGDGDRAMELLNWFKTGMDLNKYPKDLGDTNTSAMFVKNNGTCWSYGKLPYPQLCEDKFDAMGAGRDYALAAMYLGKSAREAVEVACALDVTCGNGIDVLTLKRKEKRNGSRC